MRTRRFLILALIGSVFSVTVWAQLTEGERSAVLVQHGYVVSDNITFKVANGYEAKLDVYRPRDAASRTPVVVMIHGGGWMEGSKEQAVLSALPFMTMRFAVVNVEYRRGETSRAPAAVEDCLCALHWVGRNAERYGFDLGKVIVTGDSAGGHLALASAMIPSSAGFEADCAHEDDETWTGTWKDRKPRVAAVVNWYGITDVADLLQGPNIRSFAVSWLGSQPNREELARRLSPMTYVRNGLPPILTIHGDADPIVPYAHAVRLHDALTKSGVKNQLLTIRGGRHGEFTAKQQLRAFEAIRAFLEDAGIAPGPK
jgi:acetyl esterase/lipase